MADALVRYFTGLTGLLVQIPVAGVERTVINALKRSRARHTVFTAERMVRIWFEIWRTAIQSVTFTAENSLLGFLAQTLAMGIWRLSKRFRLFAALIKAKSEAELIQVFLTSLQKRFGLVRIVALIVGWAVIAVAVGFFVWTIAMSITVLEKKVFETALPQDAKFVKTPHRYRRRRLNLKTGPDR